MPPVTPTLVSAGTTMPVTYQLLSIDVHKELDRIPQAEIRVIDGSASLRSFAASDSSFFVPGSAMELSLRYEGSADTPVFSGIVVRHGVEASQKGSVLTVVLKDPAIALTGLRKSAVFSDMDDATIGPTRWGWRWWSKTAPYRCASGRCPALAQRRWSTASISCTSLS
jgi:hypothetical protein